MFNRRRQSRDRTVIEDIVREVRSSWDKVLFMGEYSRTLFETSENTEIKYCITDDFLDIAADAWCFVEDRALADYVGQISQLVIYRWNRHYPSDRYFDIDLDKQGFSLIEATEFAGYSHEKITKEIYKA